MYAGVCGARETPGQSIASANLSVTYLDERQTGRRSFSARGACVVHGVDDRLPVGARY